MPSSLSIQSLARLGAIGSAVARAQVLAAAQRNRMEKIGFVGNEQYM